MAKRIFWVFMLMPTAAWAGEGLKHAEEWVLRRDGAWIVNFAILFAGLYWIAKRFIVPALKERSETIVQTLANAEDAKKEAMKILSDLEFKLDRLEEKKSEMRVDALAEGAQIKEELLKEAEEVSKRILDKARTEIEIETRKAKQGLQKEIVEMAVGITEKILSEKIREADQRKVFAEYLAGVGEKK